MICHSIKASCSGRQFPVFQRHGFLGTFQTQTAQKRQPQHYAVSPKKYGHSYVVFCCGWVCHYNDLIMSATASQITSLTIVYQTVYSGADYRKHQSPASLTFVRATHRWPVNSPYKGPVTRKMFPFDDVIMYWHYPHRSRLFLMDDQSVFA